MLFLDDSGNVLLNADGTVMDDDACCCALECPECFDTGTSLLVEFLQDMCSEGCADWVQAFDLHKLDQAEINRLYTEWPANYTNYAPDLSFSRVWGCTFGLFEGLPYGATSMVATITHGSDPLMEYPSTLWITIGWADGVWTTIEVGFRQDAGTDDCPDIFQPDRMGTARINWSDPVPPSVFDLLGPFNDATPYVHIELFTDQRGFDPGFDGGFA